ncbi:MAG: DUF6600 domain-containing protein [Janthinobacterium lividum]
MLFDFDISFRVALGAFLTFATIGVVPPATAQQPSQDPPARTARLNVHEGTASFSPAGEDGWYDVVQNRPLTSGDRLWTDRAARAEVFVGSAAVRTDAQTSLEFTRIDDATAQLTLSQGSLDLHLRDDPDGQRFEVDTGNLALSILAAGDYRIDADPAAGTTRVAIAAGSATVYGENGTAVAIGERQQITVSGRDLAAAGTRPPVSAAAFDRWVGERNRIEERSTSARHVSRDVVGYQQLDAYGDWRDDATYGDVWYPRSVAAGWAPYRDGQWVDIAPWGWTWIDAAPWGFAPSHYGRWARIGPRWGWVPGRIEARPVFAPALVGFVGGPGAMSGPNTGGRGGVGWFPLAPGERWQPGYRASRGYIEQANRTTIRIDRPQQRNDFYVNQRLVEALTIVPAERFGRGPIDRRDLLRQRDESFSRAPVAYAPPLTLSATVAGGVRVGQALGALNARPAAALPPPLLQPRAQIAQLAPIRPVPPRPQLAPTEGAALQQRQQQLQQIDRRREEQQQLLRRQQTQQQAQRDDQRRAAAQQEQQRQDLRRQQENRADAARDQQQHERQRDDEQRQDQQRQAQREQDRRLQAQRLERDRQEQDRQAQYRQEQQRQQVQQQQRQAQQEQQQHANQLRAQEQQLQQQRQQDRQQQQQQQSARLQEIQQAQERASQQRQFQQQQTERRQGEQRQGEQRDAERRNQQVRDDQRRDEQRRQQQR